jgi:acyl phosphate:glycerol-3-phosphate acyltransferase
MDAAAAVALGYLVGSIPFAYLLVRRRGIDLREAGSGNVGAANVLRTSGPGHAAAAMCLDAAKGALAVLIAQRLGAGAATPVAAGLAAVIGHVYPVWLGFRGGKGVATAAGAFAVLAPLAMLMASGAFVVALWATRYISVGSVVGAISLAAATIAVDASAPVSMGAAGAAVMILHRHRENLARVMAGTERRIGQRT